MYTRQKFAGIELEYQGFNYFGPMSRLGILSALCLVTLVFLGFQNRGDWGFYGHRLINRMAVFTLPPEMMYLFKPNIDFITEHAVDPDKRRYASPFEAARHYMDLDHWGQYPYDNLPRQWSEALIKYSDIVWYRSDMDSVIYRGEDLWLRFYTTDSFPWKKSELLDKSDFPQFFMRSILPHYYDDEWEIPCEVWQAYLGLDKDVPCQAVRIIDSLSSHGILPYHLIKMQRDLTEAFVDRDKSKIIRLSAEMGHYLGDAHVPLHTTSNYNGQLTDQLGIHAFWESRIPELFAEVDYDFFVGKASYISDPSEYYWNIVLTSNSFVDSVLLIEKELSITFPSDQQYCFDERLDNTVRTQCREYARAYQTRMNGMVEARMRQSVQAIGSSWYTAWIDAGQPDFRKDAFVASDQTLVAEEDISQKKEKRIKIRGHE
ncbi:MAG: hypothetical protein IPL46_23345 [Saprospiraceae bacterium]|nr:hypothetical protein [Saprospiraceae bacterium]